ncbi:hypothetical protein [Paraburkholderia sp. BL17N1]|uniref:hypothetical protein n=1 Tax=Paraburkholderia sp. BL17N1 TaxID=1938798 RepID=UPI000EB4258B|nr:hypothetical protein [Paraburkholderia sp. BL17N1]RKR45857.1 hypothetical protein B0G82_3519 [Paraburkholderia sp. BL17N1]
MLRSNKPVYGKVTAYLKDLYGRRKDAVSNGINYKGLTACGLAGSRCGTGAAVAEGRQSEAARRCGGWRCDDGVATKVLDCDDVSERSKVGMTACLFLVRQGKRRNTV